MIKRILIANRGEIAVRIIRACRDMNIETVAAYSEADREALFVILATKTICIGASQPQDSYLNINNMITAALKTGCEAIHPGFGFLAENPGFAEAVAANGLIFIGPDSRLIEMLGDKSAARAMMAACGVPVVPGSDGVVRDVAEAREIAGRLGYPVLIKAVSGGGGRGMRRVDEGAALEGALLAAAAESRACFGDDRLYLEKLIVEPRHIEIQILADRHGNVVHLGERECSIQRKNQKIIEEAPSKALDDELRARMGRDAVTAAKVCGYQNAGTVEFVLDRDGNYYFIEMNTRIQVEHPVTEMITGIDIVQEQIKIAAGQPLAFQQEEVRFTGHAIECRINAEDPENDFQPCPGTIDFLHLAGGPGVRVDTGIYAGCTVSPYYDSMLAKVIVYGQDRKEAILRMRRALEEFIAKGVKTNLGLLYMILYNPSFLKGRYDTSFLEKNLAMLMQPMDDGMML